MGTILAVVQNKGGTGKTTTTVNIAVCLAVKGFSVVIYDADPQGSALRWAAERQHAGIKPFVEVVAKPTSSSISSALQASSERYDFVILDVAGRNSREMIAGLGVADIAIAPCACSQPDLNTLDELESQLLEVRSHNSELDLYIYHSHASTNHSVTKSERNDFENYIREFPDFKLLNSIAFHRKIYKDVMANGLSVIETKNQKAKTEVYNLVEELLV